MRSPMKYFGIVEQKNFDERSWYPSFAFRKVFVNRNFHKHKGISQYFLLADKMLATSSAISLSIVHQEFCTGQLGSASSFQGLLGVPKGLLY